MLSVGSQIGESRHLQRRRLSQQDTLAITGIIFFRVKMTSYSIVSLVLGE